MIGINISFEGFLCLYKSVRVRSDSAEFSCKSFFENLVDSPSFSLFRPCNINLEYWIPYRSPSLCIVGHMDLWRVNSCDLFQKRRPDPYLVRLPLGASYARRTMKQSTIFCFLSIFIVLCGLRNWLCWIIGSPRIMEWFPFCRLGNRKNAKCLWRCIVLALCDTCGWREIRGFLRLVHRKERTSRKTIIFFGLFVGFLHQEGDGVWFHMDQVN